MSEPSIRDLQERVADFVEQNALEMPEAYRCLDLVCEVGELSKELLTRTRYGEEPFLASDGWRDEFGDVVFALFCLANSTGVDLEIVLQAAMDKYTKRLESTGSVGSK